MSNNNSKHPWRWLKEMMMGREENGGRERRARIDRGVGKVHINEYIYIYMFGGEINALASRIRTQERKGQG